MTGVGPDDPGRPAPGNPAGPLATRVQGAPGGAGQTPSRAPRSGRRRRWRRRLLLTAALALVVLVAASARLIVWPSVSGPKQADAIVVLAGAGPRVATAFRLAREGYARTVIISLGTRPTIPCPRLSGVAVACFVPSPVDTRGEAEHVARLAARHHWHRLLVVPGRFQATRAGILLHRCFSGTVYLAPASAVGADAPYLFVYQWGALLKAVFVVRSC